jgi:LuxR family quorum-sensing system transcriptional regulator CciR
MRRQWRRGVRTPLEGTGIRPGGRTRMSRSLRRLKAAAHVQAISRILGISAETARQYVKRARAAYDVVSRTQLVILGLRDEWVQFDDAIPGPRD